MKKSDNVCKEKNDCLCQCHLGGALACIDCLGHTNRDPMELVGIPREQWAGKEEAGEEE